MSETGTTEAAARAASVLRTTLAGCVGACLALGVMGLALTALTGADGAVAWPGVSLLGLGQLLALVAAAVAGWGLRRVLAGDAPRAVTARVRSALGRVEQALLVLLALGALAWVVARPEATVAILACALVSAQVAAVLHLLRR
ncbi:hypothetical protein [Georgenia sp. SYP-B2076]|uniref:hypothetical protein n=1 Tax=Georgenia sp. SYP-B2076 TaxID=2495881 RepID=UPI000F8DA169|nr:hypothetical protein [Georgenia sp. SYP-B2076]